MGRGVGGMLLHENLAVNVLYLAEMMPLNIHCLIMQLEIN